MLVPLAVCKHVYHRGGRRGACQSRPNEATKGGWGCLCERRRMPIISYQACSNQCPFVVGPILARVTSSNAAR
ncbi:expressed unknown protein [Ectocarpus siliculosus]|uniref:Uncharacterized protein n=1 Tax=Ectocarpus siliculosus TaxID=2880 RepID=D7FI74_ECTSI|nr:expressed unknown protein [Ectocarpus siliculosus]|eukprot:CBJ28699.1 expressed unknown protein [Ectocarpus siliculosus]